MSLCVEIDPADRFLHCMCISHTNPGLTISRIQNCMMKCPHLSRRVVILMIRIMYGSTAVPVYRTQVRYSCTGMQNFNTSSMCNSIYSKIGSRFPTILQPPVRDAEVVPKRPNSVVPARSCARSHKFAVICMGGPAAVMQRQSSVEKVNRYVPIAFPLRSENLNRHYTFCTFQL